MNIEQLGSQFKAYEDTRKLPTKQSFFIRIDGKSFHRVTKNFVQPYDIMLHSALISSTMQVCRSIQGALLAYIQSDEVSICCSNKQQEETQHWFDGKIQKIVSVSASLFTGYFNDQFPITPPAAFDSRIIPVAESEIHSYLIWRQLDCIRNSINKLGSYYFSKKELFKKTQQEVLQKLQDVGIKWDLLPDEFRLGTYITLSQDKRFNIIETPLFIESPETVLKVLESNLKCSVT